MGPIPDAHYVRCPLPTSALPRHDRRSVATTQLRCQLSLAPSNRIEARRGGLITQSLNCGRINLKTEEYGFRCIVTEHLIFALVLPFLNPTPKPVADCRPEGCERI